MLPGQRGLSGGVYKNFIPLCLKSDSISKQCTELMSVGRLSFSNSLHFNKVLVTKLFNSFSNV